MCLIQSFFRYFLLDRFKPSTPPSTGMPNLTTSSSDDLVEFFTRHRRFAMLTLLKARTARVRYLQAQARLNTSKQRMQDTLDEIQNLDPGLARFRIVPGNISDPTDKPLSTIVSYWRDWSRTNAWRLRSSNGRMRRQPSSNSRTRRFLSSNWRTRQVKQVRCNPVLSVDRFCKHFQYKVDGALNISPKIDF